MEYVLGAFLYHLWTRPRRSEIFFALGLGVLLRAVHHLLLGGPSNSFTSSLMGLGPYLGAASIVVLAVQVLRLAGEEAAAKLRTLEICICLGLVGPAAEQFLGILATFITPRFDPVLLASDGTLGFQPSFLLGRVFAASRIVSVFETEIYYALTLAIAVSFAMHVKNRQAHWRVNLLRAYVICTVVALGCFAFLPAAGPHFVYERIFPQSPPALSDIVLDPVRAPSAPPNCIPSVHAAYAILIWWNSFHWKRGRFAAALFLLLTLIATLGTGQHYLIDLIVAAPYSVMCQALATRTVPSKFLAFWGGGITGLWLILLRWFPSVLVAHPARMWLLALATVLTAFLMGRKLETEAYQDSNS